MKQTLFMAAAVIFAVMLAVISQNKTAVHPKQQTIFDEVNIKRLLMNGLSEVQEAIALRDKIKARGDDLYTAHIPEFESHLPKIIAFYGEALKDSSTKRAAFERLIEAVRLQFRAHKVDLKVWNQFHIFLNKIIDESDQAIEHRKWSFSEVYDAEFSPYFPCFIYRTGGEVGIQAHILAHLHQIYVLPMVSSTKSNPGITASQKTNARGPNKGFLSASSHIEQLQTIYRAIEKNPNIIERAKKHLAFFILLDAHDSESFTDSYDDLSTLEVLELRKFEIEQALLSAPKNNAKASIYLALFRNQDVDIVEKTPTRFLVTKNNRDHRATARFDVNLRAEGNKTVASYVDESRKQVSAILPKFSYESRLEELLGEEVEIVYQALGLDTRSAASSAIILGSLTDFIAAFA